MKRVEFADNHPFAIAAMIGDAALPAWQVAREALITAGATIELFPATGAGGRAMEQRIAAGEFHGLLDIETAELADELLGGIFSAGPNRLTAAAMKGIPQVIGLGGLDAVRFGPRNTVPEQFAGRRFHAVGAGATRIRTTPEENDRLGLEIAQKACAARGPTAIVVPLRGVSELDIAGGPFWWPEANATLLQSLRNWVGGVDLIEVDAHIRDPEYARVCVETLLRLMKT